MTGQRRGYVIALVVAVLALVVSVGAATFVASGNGWHLNNSARASSPDGWRQGLAGGGVMGQGRAGSGGMMGDWTDQGTPSITPDQATTAAEAWVAVNQPGATVGAGARMPMGYLFTLTKDGRSVATIIVNDDTGQVAWWAAAQPSPAATAS